MHRQASRGVSAAGPRGKGGRGLRRLGSGRSGEIWAGDGGRGEEEKNKRAVERRGLLRAGEEGRPRAGFPSSSAVTVAGSNMSWITVLGALIQFGGQKSLAVTFLVD